MFMSESEQFSDFRKTLKYIRSGKLNYKLRSFLSNVNVYECHYYCNYSTYLIRDYCSKLILYNAVLKNVPNDFDIPKDIKKVYLPSLTSAKGLKLPEGVEIVDLDSLPSTEGLKLPKSVNHVYLSSLTSAEGLEIPEGVETADLSSLTSEEGLKLPEGVKRVLLPSLTSAKDLKLSQGVGIVWLHSLTSAEGLEIPKGCYVHAPRCPKIHGQY